MNSRILAGAGSVVSALASSACCWLPLLLMGLGLSAGGVAVLIGRFRPVFLVVAAALLGVGFYLNYVRKERCAPGAACGPASPRLRRLNRGVLWISTVLVLAFASFPSYVDDLFGVQGSSAKSTGAAAESLTIAVEGMTCAGCESAVSQALAGVPGVLSAEASYEAAGATLSVDGSRPPTRLALAAAVARAGYTLVSVTADQTGAARAGLSGHWVTSLKEPDGTVIQVILDIGVVNSSWAGEFDLPDYGITDYPVEVKVTGDTSELLLTAIGMSFQGSLAEDGRLTGVAQSEGIENEPVSFQRSGPPEFSDGFLELAAAADDSTLVEVLSADGAELQAAFNADRSKTRLLMLLSPT